MNIITKTRKKLQVDTFSPGFLAPALAGKCLKNWERHKGHLLAM
jgi:hypothetical protein